MSILTDPRLFNVLLMALYVLSACRWALAGNWWQSGYWVAAFAITICVTNMGLR